MDYELKARFDLMQSCLDTCAERSFDTRVNNLEGKRKYLSELKGNTATLKDGTLAGSATNLMGCVRKAYEFDIPLEKAVKCASLNPARAIGIDKDYGSLETGKIASIVVLNDDLTVENVFIKGKKFK